MLSYILNRKRIRTPRIYLVSYLISQVWLCSSCEDLFEYSPFDMDIKSSELNIRASEKILSHKIQDSDTLKFAVFSDVHENYDDMADAIESINLQHDLQFVVCCGDITCSGLVQEFEWYVETAQKSLYPLITVIGNHDHLSNGPRIFKKLFGNPNMSFKCAEYKFITFNNIMWENYNVSPKYHWLRNELSDSSYINIVFAHIPAFAGEIDDLNRMVYDNLLQSGNVKFCVNGHFHYFDDINSNGIRTILVNAIDSREYCLIKLFGDKAFVERVKF